MIKDHTDQLTDTVDALSQLAATAINAECPDQFEQFEKKINEVEGFVREVQQEMWGAEIQAAIERLESNEALTETEVEAVRTFLISDAEHYLAVENNFGDWIEELQRIMDDLSSRAPNLRRESIGEFRGVLKDAIRLVPDIRNYLDERRRIEKFNVALHTYDTSSRSMLARVLKEHVRSSSR